MSETLKKAVTKLGDAFNDVAAELSAAYPAVWGMLDGLYGEDDPRGKAAYMVYARPPGYGGKTVLEVIEEYGEEAMTDYMASVDAGVYF